MWPGLPKQPRYPIHMHTHTNAHSHTGNLITILEYSSPPPHSPSPNFCLKLSHLIAPHPYMALPCGPNFGHKDLLALLPFLVTPSDELRSALVCTLCSKQGQPPPSLPSPKGQGPFHAAFPDKHNFAVTHSWSWGQNTGQWLYSPWI